MADQIDAGEVLEREHAENIGDVGFEIDVGTRQMAALAEPGIGRRDQPMAARRINGCIFFQTQPALHAPCATRKVAIALFPFSIPPRPRATARCVLPERARKIDRHHQQAGGKHLPARPDAGREIERHRSTRSGET